MRPPKPMRQDAATRRTQLVAAAAACFAESGYLVPLETVAARAGVGRGTLYRNFADRVELVIAVFEVKLDEIEDGLDPALPLDRTMAWIAVQGAPTAALFVRLAADLPLEGTTLARFEALASRFADLLEPAMRRAHADGSLDPRIGRRGVAIGVRMLGGLLRPQMTPAQMQSAIEEALPLLLAGLRPRAGD